jgi:hypothetical protein
MPKISRSLRLLGVALPLLLTAYNGLVEGVNATHFADTVGMRVATVTQLLYGVFGAAALLAIVFRPRWVFRLLLGWGVAVVATGLLAPIVYAGQSTSVALGVGVGTLAAVSVVLWAWHAHAATVAVPAAINQRD